MQDLSLHILDLIENSVRADASCVRIAIHADIKRNTVKIEVEDDGIGMDEEILENVINPFYTTKVERQKKIGLGVPLLKQNAESCNGSFEIYSNPGEGTKLKAVFQLDSIDRMPLGNITDTLLGAIIGHPEADFDVLYERTGFAGQKKFEFKTKEIKEELGGIPITYPDVISFIEETLLEGLKTTRLEEI
eukprot:Anaeramoba_ignava/a481579_8.p1 GENE.a481579_8~~a481579_8.p1  ORF type:complete len:190 (-),score=23.62 a481579_8:124-693(-)